MNNQYVTNQSGENIAVILSIKDYEKIMDDLDEYACIKAYDKAKQRKQEYVSASDMFKTIEQKRIKN